MAATSAVPSLIGGRRPAIFATVLLLGGCGGSDPPAAEHANSAAAQPRQVAPVGIVLDPPEAIRGSNRLALQWSSAGDLVYSVLVAANGDADFVARANGINGRSARLERGPAWRLDFPTARVKVRGCDATGGCIDSNEQPLLDALLGSVVELPSPNAGGRDGFGSAVALSADGSVLAVAGAAAGAAVGAADHLHLFERDAQGRWQARQVLAPATCARFVAGSASLDGVGATLAVTSVPASDCPAHSGAIEVFVRTGARWQPAAHIADEAAQVAQRFGALSLARDGRVLAAEAFDAATPPPWSGRARVYVRDDAGAWRLSATLAPEPSGMLRAAFGTPRLSGNGAVLAVQGIREIANPQEPTAPAQPDAFVALFTHEGASGWTARTTVRSTKPQDCCALARDNDRFAASLALDDDGSTLAVGAPGDNSDASDTVGDPGNFGRRDSGAVWIFRRTGEAAWSRHAFVKAPAGGGADFFGTNVALDRDGRVLAATALGQSQPAGVNRNHASDRVPVIEPATEGGSSFGGAAYVFACDGTGRWTQRVTAVPPLEPRTHKTLFDSLAMAFAADASTLVLGVQENTEDGTPANTSVFVY